MKNTFLIVCRREKHQISKYEDMFRLKEEYVHRFRRKTKKSMVKDIAGG